MAMAPGEIDLVMPTDYAAETCINKGLLKKIDKSKLFFFDRLNPALMGHYFDPENQYTVPYYWGVYGIGFDKDFWKDGIPLVSWQMVFDQKFKNALIAMPNDAHYLVLIAAQYLFGTIDNLTMQQIQQITDCKVAHQRVPSHHPLQGQIEESGVAEAYDNRDLKLIEKNLGSLSTAVIRAGQEEHHRNRSAVETEKHPPSRGGHESDVEYGASSHEHRRDH